MGEYFLPKKTLFLWMLRFAIVGGLLLGLIKYALGRFSWGNIPVKAIGILLAVCILVYIPLYFRSYKITIMQNAVIIQSGVIVRSKHIMPFSRLLYAQSFSSPLSRLFGLSAMTLKATRSRVFIPEISSKAVQTVILNLTAEDAK